MTEFIEMFKNLRNDYEKTFQVMKNGTIKANNENFERVQDFLKRYEPLLLFEGLVVGVVNTEVAGRKDIKIVNKNKKEIVKLLGVANQLYLRACRALKSQPDQNYANVTISEVNNNYFEPVKNNNVLDYVNPQEKKITDKFLNEVENLQI
ncbi:hypothetical protein C1645_223289 [Glomus cerebriforme]|uniref:Uncharacterized protein n=1 Tax=Glomus cerebriforme TaxID=658196 RepID=A0A397SRU0_9GLOM|nr:hypothetical protein C1645_223289 [Glomus cerebriforme]